MLHAIAFQSGAGSPWREERASSAQAAHPSPAYPPGTVIPNLIGFRNYRGTL